MPHIFTTFLPLFSKRIQYVLACNVAESATALKSFTTSISGIKGRLHISDPCLMSLYVKDSTAAAGKLLNRVVSSTL